MSKSEYREYFNQLIDRYQEGNASEAEKDFVERYYQSFEKKAGLYGQLSNSEKEATGRNLKAKIDAAIDGNSNKKVLFIRRNLFFTVSVAASIIFILAGGYFFLNSKFTVRGINPQLTAKHAVKEDIFPGVKKATLTLDGGEKIVLDSAQNGILARQGNTAITNINGALSYTGKNDGPIRYNTLTTQKGQQYPLTLSDGTEIFLDASTSIRFPVAFTGNDREVTINGRAYFHVAENKALPFYVIKGDRKVRVYGTQFNVSAYDNEKDIKVTLVQGSVQVSNGKKATMITPGQQAVLSIGTEDIKVIENADVEQAIAWKNGIISMHHADMSDILKEIERWYDVEVVVNGVLPQKDFYFSVSRNVNLSDLLRIFEIYHIKYKIDAQNRKLTVNP
jgi:hypothetical protein